MKMGLKFLGIKENDYLKELKGYVKGTHNKHYAGGGKIQQIEKLISEDRAKDFIYGNIGKYSDRYGKKFGYNREDLLKVAHYAILALIDHDYNRKDNDQ